MKLTLENIQKSYGDVEVIKDLNLTIQSGELVSLLGPSGCGKSTMLFMISGLEELTGGRILFDNKDVTHLSADKRNIGLVFQNYALYPHMTVLKNVMYPISNKKIPKEKAKKMAFDILKSVNLEEHINKKPGELSGGQQQRVAIARAIAKKPEVLLLDEPISNLDAKLKEKTIKEIRRIQKEYNITTIFVTHDQQEALAVSDRIVLLDKGKIQQIGKPKDLYISPANLYVAKFIGSPSINVLDVVIKNKKVIGLEEVINGDLNIQDGEYKLGIRPENIHVDFDQENASVLYEEILGRDILIKSKADKYEFDIVIRNKKQINIDKAIGLEILKKDVLLFDKNSGDRVL